MSEWLKRDLRIDTDRAANPVHDLHGKASGQDHSLGKIKSDLLVAQTEVVQQHKRIQTLIADLNHLANENLNPGNAPASGQNVDAAGMAKSYEQKINEFIRLYESCWDVKCAETRLKYEAQKKNERIEYHLAYQIGQAIVQTYKNYPPVIRWCKLPFAISGAKRVHRQYRDAEKSGGHISLDESRSAQARLTQSTPSTCFPLGVKNCQCIIDTAGYEQPVFLIASVLTAGSHEAVDVVLSITGDQGREEKRAKLQDGKAVVLVSNIETSNRLILNVKSSSKTPALLKLEIVKDPNSKEIEIQEAYFTLANQHIDDESAWLQSVNAYFSSIDALPLSLRSGEGTLFSRLDSHVPAEKTISDGPKVSVIMTAYNVESLIETAMRSILNQTWKNIELIVVDDKSSDATRDVVTRMMAQDDRVRLICNDTNKGTYFGRNTAFQAASGEYVTCHDSDDWAHPERIQRQIQALLTNPAKVASMSGCIRMVDDGRFLVQGNTFPHNNSSSILFRKDVIQPVLGYWDTVRVAADSEYRRRMKLAFGSECIVDMTEIMLICTARAQSLTQNSIYGIYSNGSLSAARFRYQSVYRSWHSEIEKSKNYFLPFPLKQRMFEAPRSILPESEEGTVDDAAEYISNSKLDVLEINDSLQVLSELPLSFEGDALIEGDILLDSNHAYHKGRIVIAKNGYDNILYEKKISPKNPNIRIGGILKGCTAGDRLLVMFIPSRPRDMLHAVKGEFTAGLLPENRGAPALHDQSRTAALATYPGRINVLPDVIDSLLPQVDALFIYLNNYTSVPGVIKNHPQRHKIHYVIDTTSSKRAAAKFFWTGSAQGYHIICDDDILYPHDYVETMVRKIESYNRRAIVGVHGTRYSRYVEDFRTSRNTMYHYEQNLSEDTPVHALGTGTIAFHSSLVSNVDFSDMLKFPVSTDQVLACLARKKKIPMVCVQRAEGWMQSNPNMLFGIFTEKTTDKVLRQTTSDIVKEGNPWPQKLKLPTSRRSFLSRLFS